MIQNFGFVIRQIRLQTTCFNMLSTLCSGRFLVTYSFIAGVASLWVSRCWTTIPNSHNIFWEGQMLATPDLQPWTITFLSALIVSKYIYCCYTSDGGEMEKTKRTCWKLLVATLLWDSMCIFICISWNPFSGWVWSHLGTRQERKDLVCASSFPLGNLQWWKTRPIIFLFLMIYYWHPFGLESS